MNSSAISWISQQFDFMESFDEVFGQDFQNYSTPGSNSTNLFYTSSGIEQQPTHQMSENHSKFGTPDQSASSARIILNFANQNPSENIQQVNPMRLNPEEVVVVPDVFKSTGKYNANSEEATTRIQTKKKRVRPPSQTYDHIISERRRREQLSQLFVALSALVPGLKKMDKSSILEDGIKYLKLLQERVKLLEEKAEKKGMESVVLVKRSQIVVDDEGSSDELSSVVDEQSLPEIEALVCDKQILLRIHCENQKGVLVKLICKVESLNMIVISTNAVPFGNVALDITIVAEKEKQFNLMTKEVMIALRSALESAA